MRMICSPSMANRILQMDVSEKLSEDLHDLSNIQNELYELSGYSVRIFPAAGVFFSSNSNLSTHSSLSGICSCRKYAYPHPPPHRKECNMPVGGVFCKTKTFRQNVSSLRAH